VSKTLAAPSAPFDRAYAGADRSLRRALRAFGSASNASDRETEAPPDPPVRDRDGVWRQRGRTLDA
jgi:hypothetical protein